MIKEIDHHNAVGYYAAKVLSFTLPLSLALLHTNTYPRSHPHRRPLLHAYLKPLPSSRQFPPPLTNRDFVNHRGWQVRRDANPPLWVICNHSVQYPGFGEKSGFVR